MGLTAFLRRAKRARSFAPRQFRVPPELREPVESLRPVVPPISQLRSRNYDPLLRAQLCAGTQFLRQSLSLKRGSSSLPRDDPPTRLVQSSAWQRAFWRGLVHGCIRSQPTQSRVRHKSTCRGPLHRAGSTTVASPCAGWLPSLSSPP